jgi:hypothetical protein
MGMRRLHTDVTDALDFIWVVSVVALTELSHINSLCMRVCMTTQPCHIQSHPQLSHCDHKQHTDLLSIDAEVQGLGVTSVAAVDLRRAEYIT